ncbi:ABSCISIC ACID-INSENSITIVE 5-like protein 3 [Lycium barbarum]|uniref:ABSCISIC ACID-INSENSITIVE 5-like protein 3 n=1 Tax=Lycium barbarum TaxID=112863 RepID=UPI00293E9249|nr:ABSCISIC ACID-INSENSITIVE 5-like protein 3 [Lycium barbarum]
MNLDELVAKNVMSGEEGLQFMQNTSSNSMFLENMNHGTLCKKTSTHVDEIWSKQENHHSSVHKPQLSSTNTLEDFLIHGSVIKSENKLDDIVPKLNQQNGRVLPMPMPIQSNSDTINFENQQAMDVVNYPEKCTTNMAMPAATITTTTSNECHLIGEQKRPFVDEKSIERRQSRMIKNRESAARSRARKQAYTKQLEQEVLELRKTNSWLKKQKDLEKLLCSNAEPRHQLRRTSSASF